MRENGTTRGIRKIQHIWPGGKKEPQKSHLAVLVSPDLAEYFLGQIRRTLFEEKL
jgi:hypothetical protein